MIDRVYLEKYQPRLFRSFSHALTEKKIPHALLLSGESGTPLLSVALFLARSLVCEHPDPLACGHCLNCLRFIDGNYPDFILIDGASGSVKKESVISLENNFAETAASENNRMIYVIHLVENMTSEAINALLKFLEEPHEGVYAILTTENEAKVLPTIVSRCANLPLNRIARSEVIKAATTLGISQTDAEILSDIANDPDMLKELATGESYAKVGPLFIDFIHQWSLRPSAGAYTLAQIAGQIKGRDEIRLFLDLFATFVSELIAVGHGQPAVLSGSIREERALLKRENNLSHLLKEIIRIRGAIDLSLNPALVFDHLGYYIIKES